jgi:hypothetical protein
MSTFEQHQTSSLLSSINYYTPLNNQPTNQQPINNQTFNMLFTTIITSFFATMALSAPVELNERQAVVCSGTTAQCCATDVLNLADLDCATRKLLHSPFPSPSLL